MASDKLFIDSSYFCAIGNKLDYHFKRSKEFGDKLDNSLTSNFVLLESYTVISQRAGRSKAILFGEKMQNQEHTKILLVTSEVEEATWKIFKRVKNKNMSYVDCSILALIKKYRITALLTFDTHFKPYEKEFNFKVLQ